MAIFVIGLGPGGSDLLTVQAQHFLDAASDITSHIYVRTLNHPSTKALPPSASIHSFDALYEGNTVDAHQAVAQTLIDKARSEPVIYAVPGHPLVGEPSVRHLLALAREQNIPVEILDGLSFIEPALATLGLDPLATGLQILSAAEVTRGHYPHIDPDRPALITHISNEQIVSDLKRLLLAQYPSEHEMTVIHVDPKSQIPISNAQIALRNLQVLPRETTALYIPPLPRPSSLESFAEIVAHLRAPDGCPWDREQTPQTLRRYLLEEAYEALEAIDLNQPQRLKEELGDLLLQIVLQSQIAFEQGEFNLRDVIAHIHAKIVRRHPHVFGELKGASMQQIEENWEKIKRGEKDEGAAVTSFFKDIPAGLPALAEAEDMQMRAWRVNLWNAEPADAEAQAAQAFRRWSETPDSESLGEALFMLVDQARRAGLDAESALREANKRFAMSLQ